MKKLFQFSKNMGPASFKDSLNLLSKILKYSRLSNGVKLYLSYQKSKKSKNATIKGLPIAASIEPTTSCNLRCPQCPSGLRSFTRDTGMLDIKMYQSFIEENFQSLLYLLLYFQGEPYLHPQFFEMVRLKILNIMVDE